MVYTGLLGCICYRLFKPNTSKIKLIISSNHLYFLDIRADINMYSVIQARKLKVTSDKSSFSVSSLSLDMLIISLKYLFIYFLSIHTKFSSLAFLTQLLQCYFYFIYHWNLHYFHFLEVYFIDYAITVVPFFLPFIPLRSAPIFPPAVPLLSSCPWVIHISSLASTFPILFLPSPLSIFYLPFMLLISRTFSPFSPIPPHW